MHRFYAFGTTSVVFMFLISCN